MNGKKLQVILGVVAVGCLVFGFVIQGAPPDQRARAINKYARAKNTARGIPQELPVLPPSTVDYRNNAEPDVVRVDGELVAIGASWEGFAGMVAAGTETCTDRIFCSDCERCTQDECEGGKCTHTPNQEGTSPIGCDDGLFCNGLESCDANGACVDGTPPCQVEGLVCDEGANPAACISECENDDNCNDGLDCTTDTCDVETGECAHTNNCGPGAECTEPGGECGVGRCCDAGNACTETTFADCTGNWLAEIFFEPACGPAQPSGNVNDCPDYASGISPQGTFETEIGPISGLDCDTITSVGDDYKIGDGTGFYNVEFLRFAGGVVAQTQDPARWDIEFYTIDGVFIEDVFWPDGGDDRTFELGIRTVDFDPPLTIPKTGIIVWHVQQNFSPQGRVTMLATDVVDVGSNDATKMWFNGVYGDVGPPDVPADKRILAFELVGSDGDDPTGACCERIEGACSRELPWICERDQGGFVGGECDNCLNDPFGPPCSVAADCFKCVGGTRGGQRCGDPQDCPGGTCDKDDPDAVCTQRPPACRQQACCDNTSGDCIGLHACLGGIRNGGFCDFNEQCPGACSSSNPVFPNDTVPCDINDDCWRCTGGARDGGLCGCPGGSCVDGVCNMGSRIGQDCDCPDGGVCDNSPVCNPGTCPLACPKGTKPQGFGTKCQPNCCEQPEPVGGDNCQLIVDGIQGELQLINVPAVGTAPVTVTITDSNRLATHLGYPDLDCGLFPPDAPSPAPAWWIGFSIDDCANVRLDFCCTDISGEPLRPAFATLFKDCPCTGGTGTSGVETPIGIGRDTRGFARGGPFCDEDNLWMTHRTLRAGQYFYPIYGRADGTSAVPPGVDFQYHITVGACPVAVCCTGEDCQILNALECADLDGYWLAFETTPEEVGNVVSCGTTEESNPCRIGSCCLGPGDCEDRATGLPCDRTIPGRCIDEAGCRVLANTPEEEEPPYVGGGSCDYPVPPCPVCDIAGGLNCQLPGLTENSWVNPSDLAISPAGNVVADDFVPTGDTISTVCTWGAYIDGTDCDSGGQGAGCDCSAEVTDDFRITVYEDAGGYPGTLVGSSAVTTLRAPVNSAFGLELPDMQMYEFQFALDDPIGGLETVNPTVYWLEIANNTALPENNKCIWQWAYTAESFNNYSAVGAVDGYRPGGTHTTDMAFCLDMTLDQVPVVEAACCACPGDGGECSGPNVVADCRAGQWDVTEPVCEGVDCPTGPVNDACANAIIINTAIFSAATDTTCATTDGPPHNSGLGSDVWFEYTVPCTGKVTVSMCGSSSTEAGNPYDSMLAVYHDVNDPTNCPPCPVDAGFLIVDETLADEGCDGTFNGGSGIVTTPPSFPGDCLLIRVGGFESADGRGHLTVGCAVTECFPSNIPEEELLGVGVFASPNRKNRYISVRPGNAGREQRIRIRFKSLPLPFNVWNHDPAGGPAPNGDYFVGEPFQRCENGGEVLFSCMKNGTCSNPPPNRACSTDVDCCGAAGPLPQNWFWAAPLVCNVTDAALRKWRGECIDGTCDAGLNKDEACANDEDCSPVVHVSHEGLVPGGVYDVQVVDGDCSPSLETSYSEPLEITQAVWGDLCSNGPGGACTGVADGNPEVIQDVLGLIDKFQNINALQKSMADLVPGDDGTHNGPDFKVTIIGDALFALDAFQGFPYPFDPGDPCAADSGLSSQGVALSVEEGRPVREGSR